MTAQPQGWSDRDERGQKALDFIERRGYRRCDIPACNCGSWHGGNAENRLRDFHEALVQADVETNGKTLLGALGEVLAERAALASENERLREALSGIAAAADIGAKTAKTVPDRLGYEYLRDEARAALAPERAT